MPVIQFHPDFEELVSPHEDFEVLAEGLGTETGPTEGPVWWHELGYLLFSDIGNDSRLRWSPTEGITLAQQPSNRGNGMTRDAQGRLVVCEQEQRRVVRFEGDGRTAVIADQYQGFRLNRPNDVIVGSDGCVYFTDPATMNVISELGFCGVYRVSSDLSTITLLVDDFLLPNGLALSADETHLHIVDSRHKHIRTFEVAPDTHRSASTSRPSLLAGRVLCSLSQLKSGAPDGIKVDSGGNVYCAGPGGIWIFNSYGTLLGSLALVHQLNADGKLITPVATNLAWGDNDWRTLYVTTQTTLCRFRLNISGIPVPAARSESRIS